MKKIILPFVISSILILFFAGYFAIENNPYSGTAASVAGYIIGAIIVLAAKAIIFRHKTSPYDVMAIAVITILFSLATATFDLFFSNSPPLIKALLASTILLIAGFITLKIFHHPNKGTLLGKK
ncbi:hypothetical protein H2Y56_16445 [Pectobacterium aroidearum]|uniref:Uncharacterized protein n=1 Tax=Pectobacterium aroidearum TaxID=1201031 RepID=A0ABR5ZGP6_9GAMM|nr:MULTISPECIES: hypothetical protein [Pectobacterium]MBA5200895.1 hypothetical protein [Pectobacterium aroidearum]MBA5229277.1 hypothetical protein [Pectobacterium aroidearum]MBA5233687.1 hypothetical protein [Pectobacterium aroidearum]MBA5738720.1 hypothetical protein [Pectobacterium aroidearum]UXK01491.1 hypothetical protein N5056_05830 [Pectobacterium aroidearum]